MITTLAFCAMSAAVALAPHAADAAQQRGAAPLREIQGFHVVLLLGDVQKGPDEEGRDLPEGAARAIKDMSEFLPYKRYRVMDAQWTSCCSGPSSTVSGRLRGVIGVPAPNGATNLVHRIYQFSITASQASSGIQTRFVLNVNDGKADQSGHQDTADLERELKNVTDDIATTTMRLEEARQKVEVGVLSPLDLRGMQDKLTALQREAEGRKARLERLQAAGSSAVMDSSFTMTPGETVVVGTSRLGGDTALIALVTAARRR